MNCWRSQSSESHEDGEIYKITSKKRRKCSEENNTRPAKVNKTASNSSSPDRDYLKSFQELELNKNECKSEEQSDQMDFQSNYTQDMSAAGNLNNLASDMGNASYSGKDSNASRRYNFRSGSFKSTDKKTTYILIPILKISGEILPTPNQLIKSTLCKLIDGYPYEKMPPSEIRIRKSYVMSYNEETKNANWVYEILNKVTLKTNCKETMSFGRNELKGKKDHDQGRKKSKITVYDQGHLAAAGNHRWCQEAYHDTYLISNMVPQNKSLNQGDWKTIEGYCRRKAKKDVVCNVHLYTGPLYLKIKQKNDEPKNDSYDDVYDRADRSEMQRLGGKAVPTHIFKMIIIENKDGTIRNPDCYVMPKLDTDTDMKRKKQKKNNKKTEKEVKHEYSQSFERIQILSGLKFIESHPNVEIMDGIETITWTGEGEKGKSCSVKINIGICSVYGLRHRLYSSAQW